MSKISKVRVDLSVKEALASKLLSQNEIFGFQEDPALASLCTCIGLQFEMGKSQFDRLSPFFGVLPSEKNQWTSDILSTDCEFGVEFRRIDRGPLEIRHRDLGHIIDSLSFDEKGELSKIVIFPSRVARHFLGRGFQLVIVRDWVLSSCLNPTDSSRVSYLLTNEWEIRNNVAKTQATLMSQHRLAFSGTHDIVDHLLNADIEKFDRLGELFALAKATLDSVFPEGSVASDQKLILSYLIGVLLDDLAQPRWYGSQKHARLTQMALSKLTQLNGRSTSSRFFLPSSFHELVSFLRSKEECLFLLNYRFDNFIRDLVCYGDEFTSPPKNEAIRHTFSGETRGVSYA